jgi:F-type H+-transporting ATPase subunit delta
MKDRKAVARYAKAFFEEAREHGVIDEAAGDLLWLKHLWARAAEWAHFLAQPTVTAERKKALCREHLQSLLHPQAARYLDLLIDRKRTGLLPDIADQFQSLADDHEGIVRAQVRSAAPLTPEEEGRLEGIIGQAFRGRPDMTVTVSPELIGGLTVRVKDTFVDGSVRTSLRSLAADLRSVTVTVPTQQDRAED